MSEYIMPNGAKSRTYNADCVEKMREYPDGYFDLAVVDPPYGGGGAHIQGQRKDEVRRDIRQIRCERTGSGWFKKYGKK